MDDRIRISDADREGIAARLRDHYAEGRLTSDELDERLTAALSAKTFGDLRRVMTDLPEPTPTPTPLATRLYPARSRRSAIAAYRGPRLLPLALFALLTVVLISSAGWLFVAVLKVFLVAWLVICLATLVIAARFRRRLRRGWPGGNWHQHLTGGNWPGSHWPGGEWPGGEWPGSHKPGGRAQRCGTWR
jgi:hypothetical protein